MEFAYFGPETTLPVASALMTVVGAVLMVLRVTASRLSFGFLFRKPRRPE